MRRLFPLFLIPLLFVACAKVEETTLPATVDQSKTEATGTIKEEKPVTVAKANKLSEIPESCLELPENKDLITKPFQMVNDSEGVGQATLSGTISSRREEVWGETVERVYFAVQEPAVEGTGLKFYNYFKGMVDSGNTVNLGSKAETAIGFAIGAIQDGKFSTTAGVSDGAYDAIMNALNTGESIWLTLSIPKYEGRGAPANFSFACMIEL